MTKTVKKRKSNKPARGITAINRREKAAIRQRAERARANSVPLRNFSAGEMYDELLAILNDTLAVFSPKGTSPEDIVRCARSLLDLLEEKFGEPGNIEKCCEYVWRGPLRNTMRDIAGEGLTVYRISDLDTLIQQYFAHIPPKKYDVPAIEVLFHTRKRIDKLIEIGRGLGEEIAIGELSIGRDVVYSFDRIRELYQEDMVDDPHFDCNGITRQ